MQDLRIINAKVVLKVTSLAPIRGFSPPSILVVGEKLNLTQEIQYNGIQADEFFITSPTKVIVRIPPSQVGKQLNDLKLLSSTSVAKADATIALELTHPLRMVSGIDRLVQSWMILFMTTPGSDVFSPKSGGGVRTLVGSRTDKSGRNVAADLALAVDRTKTELIRLQSNAKSIPFSERLLSASLASVQFDESTTTLSGVVVLQNMLGATAQVSVQSK